MKATLPLAMRGGQTRTWSRLQLSTELGPGKMVDYSLLNPSLINKGTTFHFTGFRISSR
jgi:hypothetical protein